MGGIIDNEDESCIHEEEHRNFEDHFDNDNHEDIEAMDESNREPRKRRSWMERWSSMKNTVKDKLKGAENNEDENRRSKSSIDDSSSHEDNENEIDTDSKHSDRKSLSPPNKAKSLFTSLSSSPSWIPSDITWPDPTNPDVGTFPSDDFRNQRFKLYPMIVDGPWVVKTAVRACPCLLGQKVVQRYFRGDRYFEIDVHVASSIIAKQIVGVCREYAKNFSANIGLILEAIHEEELPEQLMGCFQIDKIDMDTAKDLD